MFIAYNLKSGKQLNKQLYRIVKKNNSFNEIIIQSIIIIIIQFTKYSKKYKQPNVKKLESYIHIYLYYDEGGES